MSKNIWFNLLFIISIALVFHFPSAAQWVKLNGPSEVEIRTLSVKPNLNNANIWNIYAGTWGNGIFLSSDNGNSWALISHDFQYISSMAIIGNAIVASVIGSEILEGIYRSTNNGVSWSDNTGLVEVNSFITIDSILFASGNEGGNAEDPKSEILISKDSGATWQRTAGGGVFWIFSPHSLCVKDTTLFVVAGGSISLSKDKSESWINIGVPRRMVNTIATSVSNIYAGTDSGLFVSSDNGTNWNLSDSSFPRTNVTQLATNGLNIFAATNNNLYLSCNDGKSWERIDSGLTNISVTSIAFTDTMVYIGTSDSGVWRRPFSEMITSVPQEKKQKLVQFILEDNYPNPFNPSTKIQFLLPKATHVILNIYNSLGQKVKQLVSQYLNAGTYTEEWNASGFASGVYFYRIEAGSFVETKKLVLLR